MVNPGAELARGTFAAFTTFLSCFAKLSVKSSKAAKLFNAVQQAQVSWGRIKGFLHTPPEEKRLPAQPPCTVEVSGLSVPGVFGGRGLQSAGGTDNRRYGIGSVRKKYAWKGVFVRKSV